MRKPCKRVLIVEDNLLTMKLFAAIINSCGHNVLEAPTAARGLDLAREMHPDLIITALSLPDMSGLQLAKTIKADIRQRAIRVLASAPQQSAGGFAQDGFAQDGFDGFMAMPISIDAFAELVEAALGTSDAQAAA